MHDVQQERLGAAPHPRAVSSFEWLQCRHDVIEEGFRRKRVSCNFQISFYLYRISLVSELLVLLQIVLTEFTKFSQLLFKIWKVQLKFEWLQILESHHNNWFVYIGTSLPDCGFFKKHSERISKVLCIFEGLENLSFNKSGQWCYHPLYSDFTTPFIVVYCEFFGGNPVSFISLQGLMICRIPKLSRLCWILFAFRHLTHSLITVYFFV